MAINSVDAYLRQLREELKNCDRATVQDALSDAEEYLRNAVENLKAAKPGTADEQVFAEAVEEYGTPAEIADAYRKIEARTSPSLIPRAQKKSSSVLGRFFGVLVDPRAWGGLLYLLLAMVTGIIYFTWTVTGISLSLGLLILVIGIPIAGIFMLSTRGLALLEGRMVEALLGVRMPHRPMFDSKDKGLWAKFKSLITDKYTWFSMVYMLIQMPLGIGYFSMFSVLIFVSLYFVLWPLIGAIFHFQVVLYQTVVTLAPLGIILIMILGVLLFVSTLHLAKIMGNAHGRLAKAMLVRE